MFHDIFNEYNSLTNDPEEQRAIAVAADLEIIKSDVAASGERKAYNMKDHMSRLSEYADTIQEALKVK